jgi:hypothetical protein
LCVYHKIGGINSGAGIDPTPTDGEITGNDYEAAKISFLNLNIDKLLLVYLCSFLTSLVFIYLYMFK